MEARCARCGWRRDVHEEHEDYVGKLRWSSQREKAERSVKMADEMKQKIAECKTGAGRT